MQVLFMQNSTGALLDDALLFSTVLVIAWAES